MKEELKQAIKSIEKRIAKKEFDIANDKGQIKSLQGCTEISKGSDLIRMYFNGSVNVKTVKKNYESLLGGDGRSSAYSEEKKGMVLTIEYPVNIVAYERDIEGAQRLISSIEKENGINYVEMIINRLQTNYY